jgi:isopropylmalate/homocitrate/citramalate synthase
VRDGCRGAGISLSLQDKLDIARRLDAFGVDWIEGGRPGSNPKTRSSSTPSASGRCATRGCARSAARAALGLVLAPGVLERLPLRDDVPVHA